MKNVPAAATLSVRFTVGAKRAVPAIVLTASLAVLAACSSPPSSARSAGGSSSASASATASASAAASASATPARAPSPYGTGTIRGAADATALFKKAVADTEAATSLRMAAKKLDDGKGKISSFELTIVKDKGCEGSMSAPTTGSFKVIESGHWIWFSPSPAMWKKLHVPQTFANLFKGHYIKVSATNKIPGMNDLAKLCTVADIFAGLPTVDLAVPATFAGQPAYKVTETGQSGAGYVTNTVKPLMLAISPKGSAAITFSDYDAVKRIVTPPASKTVDGSQFGL